MCLLKLYCTNHVSKVNELIDKANAQFEERNERALERGEEALKPMLPLVRLKVRNVFPS